MTSFRNPLMAAMICLMAAVALAMGAEPAAAGMSGDDSGLSVNLRRALEAPVRKVVSELLAEKNSDGHRFRRGTFSRSFKKVDDSTYEVTLHQDTVVGDSLTTERYLVTLTNQDGGGKWTIASKELQDSFGELTRRMPYDETFHRFDSFSFEKEGLKITATNGSMGMDYRAGELEVFWLVAEDLAYTYLPPLEQDRALWEMLNERHADYIVEDPESAVFNCDPITCRKLLQELFTGIRDADKEDLDREMVRRYEDFMKKQRKNRIDRPFRGYRMPYEEGNFRYNAWLSRGRGESRRALGIEVDNLDPIEVTFSTSETGPLYAYYTEETRNSNPDPLLLEQRDDRSGRDFDLEGLRGTVELALGDPEAMSADVTYYMTAKRDLEVLRFAIARLRIQGGAREAKNPLLSINSIQDGAGEELTWVRTGPFSGLIILPEEVAEDDDLVIRMQFDNKNVIYKLTSTYSYMSRGGWLPFVRFGDMIPSFDLTVKVPDRYTTLGIGSKISESEEDGVNTTRWIAKSPVVFPTLTFGVYHSKESKAKKLDGTEIPVNVYLDKDSVSNYTIPVATNEDIDGYLNRVDFSNISLSSLARIAGEAVNSINLFEKIYGVDYPYDKLDLVNDPLAFLYGQAPSSTIYLGIGAFFGEGSLANFDALGGRVKSLTKFTRSLVAHEVAHQWWGSVVTNKNFFNYWFVESIAEYSAALYLEAVYGKKAYYDHVESWRREILDFEPLNSVQSASYLWTDRGGYRSAVYSKGPYAFHILRTTFGDKKFFSFLKMLAQELEGEEIVTRDIQRITEKAFGGGMDWFFDQWIRGVGIPEYKFTYETILKEDGSYTVSGQIEQRVVVGKHRDELEGRYFQSIVPVTVVAKGGKEYQKQVVLKGAKTSFEFTVPDKPRKVILNKYGEGLAHDVIVTKSSRSKRAASR